MKGPTRALVVPVVVWTSAESLRLQRLLRPAGGVGGTGAGRRYADPRRRLWPRLLSRELVAGGAASVVPPNPIGCADDSEIFDRRRGDDLAGEAAWLAQIARAYLRSPVG